MSNSNGTHMQRIRMALGIALALSTGVGGCKDDDGAKSAGNLMEDTGGSATETNGQPAPCDRDGDCPEGIDCVFATDGAEHGFCNVNEIELDAGPDAASDSGPGVSSAAPALCVDATDCPEGIECVLPNGDAGTGFCDVSEMTVTPSSASPAPCMSGDDCPEGIDCIQANGDGTTGFCDVSEMIAP